MKLVIRAQMLCFATLAALAVSSAWAAQPMSVLRNSTTRSTADSAPGGGDDDNSSGSNSLLAEPESIAAPLAQGDPDDGNGNGDGDWGDNGNYSPNNRWANGRFQRGLWYGGVDYLLFRPRFSQAVAEVRQQTINTNGVSEQFNQSVQFPFRYQSGFRATLGYRLINCGGDIQFTYWRLNNTAQTSDGPASVADGSRVILGQLWNNPADGQFLNASAGVTANLYDLDFAKCLGFGGPRGPCDVCFCPRWDLRWFAGVRLADISRFDNNSVTNANGNIASFGNINSRFVGAGPRVGLQGRRYFGQKGVFSVYARGSQALLLGDYHLTRSSTFPGTDPVTTSVTTQIDTFSRIVPVTDIEIGVSWQVAAYTFISAGYFFQCWWDLGQAENIGGTAFPALDSANILGFDGLFVRGEMLF